MILCYSISLEISDEILLILSKPFSQLFFFIKSVCSFQSIDPNNHLQILSHSRHARRGERGDENTKLKS